MTEIRTVSSTGGEKGQKPERVDLVPPEIILALSRHFAVGAEKYDDHNFRRGYPWSLSYAAAQRHLLAFWGGEDIDPETGTPHVIAAMWHCGAMYLFMREHPDFDDRYRAES